jgi:hypothetical protein
MISNKQKKVVTTGWLVMSGLVSACGGGHEQPTARPSSVQTIAATDNEAASVSATATTTQRVTAASSSSVAGAAIEIPPGALAVDLGITLQEGESLATFASTVPDAAALGITAAGPTVLVSSSIAIETLSPLSLTLPMPETSLKLQTVNGTLAVAFITTVVKDGVSSNLWGLIPPSAIEVGSKAVKIKTTRFGAFQVVRTATPLTAAVETPIATPPIPKATAQAQHWGLWRSECFSETTSVGHVLWVKTWANIGRDTIEFREEEFSDAECTKGRLTSTVRVSYKLSGSSPLITTASHLDGIFQQVSLTPFEETAIATFNATELCGFNDWTVKVTKDISGRVCDSKTGEAQPKAGELAYTLLEVLTTETGVDQLRLGKQDGRTPETRSTELEDPARAMKRVR